MLTGGGPSELVYFPLDDLVSVCDGGYQVVEMGVKIISQVCTLGENVGFSVWVSPWNRSGLVVGTMLWTSCAAAAPPN